MRPFLALALRLLDGVTQGLNVIGSVLILLLMILVGVDVAGRNLAGAPVAGVPELVTLSIVAIVFLQIPQALRAGRLTRSDALMGWLEPPIQMWIDEMCIGLGLHGDALSVLEIWKQRSRNAPHTH